MSSAAPAVLLLGGGAVLLYVGITGQAVVPALRSVLRGERPAGAAEPGTTPPARAAGTGTASGAVGNAGPDPKGQPANQPDPRVPARTQPVVRTPLRPTGVTA